MKKPFYIALWWLVSMLLLASDATAQQEMEDDGGNTTTTIWGSSQDPSSYSNVDAFAPSHISFDFVVDFEQSATIGTITHTLTVLSDGADVDVVYFDVWDAVQVDAAEYAMELEGPFEDLDFEITTPNPNIGNALAVMLPMAMEEGTMFYVRFTYKSLPETTALSWLTPQQTAGKTLPFVYSLCQMNFCRDWAPMMDTPSQKITYDATIVAPSEFVVSMSGNETSSTVLNETHTRTTFECNEKIPSYQLALIVGDLEKRALSDRVIVFAEEPYIEAAVKEFEDLPAVLDSTEAYLTPYIWGNYSIFVMPPSFPWGGMEHVNANQVSHTLLAGDKSMLYTAIHEITHSWFGNDVGCKNWNNFWINEGMNVFMERKVLEDFYGLDYVKIDYFTGNTSMVEQMLDWYSLTDPYSSLFPDIGDDDPENSFSSVPYEKGSQFMYYIETLLGPQATQNYLRDYIREFHGMAIDSPELRTFYEEWVISNMGDNATTILEMTMWDTWMYEPGVAPVPLDFYTEAVESGQILAREYVALALLNETETEVSRRFSSPPNHQEYFEYYGSQKVAFVQELNNLADDVTAALLEHIDSDLNISLGEIYPKARNDWYVLGIKQGYDAVMEPAYEWTGSQGRSAYVRPVFDALIEAEQCEIAIMWCNDFCASYNIYVSSRVQRAIEEGCSTDGEGGQDSVGGGDETTGSDESGETGESGSTQNNVAVHSVWTTFLLAAIILMKM